MLLFIVGYTFDNADDFSRLGDIQTVQRLGIGWKVVKLQLGVPVWKSSMNT